MSGENRYHAILKGRECFAVCPSDTAVALTALDAILKIAGPGYVRTISIKDFFKPLGNDLTVDEMITEVQVPALPNRSKQTFLKFRLRKAIDFATVSVALVLTNTGAICKDARIVLGGVAHSPIRAMEAEQIIKGKTINTAIAEAASEASVTGAAPLKMNAYKVEITKTLVKRALLSWES